ncbi:MAG: hypothetical protein N0A16_00715 [Blastocatellia bacterium]|nr:hypothetical protein [Blastocatellia bacterium]MCS7156234.1 hypothetical protein [Blastocatellia bacterium]MCX7751416.1 hypothetical protein [Blastocatellia bacterium]MDW8169129.1 hypothetical protein [Acidobacteriota bacterium]MDW8255990.1 hypothetical protein [Acidobacteriota bacterium]
MERSSRTKELLDRVERMVEEDPQVLVPVRKLWMRLQQECPWMAPPTFAEFLALLREDERFEYWSLGERSEEEFPTRRGPWSAREAAAYECGPRVKLRRIPVTEALLIQILRHHIQGLLEILQGSAKAFTPRSPISPDGGADPHRTP